MSKKLYKWILNDASYDNSVVRYCHSCGKKMSFRDSKKRRHNANGKIIYEYAIYKCEKDHTWNLLINSYKADVTEQPLLDNTQLPEFSGFEAISLIEHANQGIREIEIFLEEVIGRWRIDKLLGDRIQDLSRTKVCDLIRQGRITLDGKEVKRDVFLKKQQTITITLAINGR